MRRVLAIIGLVLVIGGLVMMPISLIYNINFIIPIGMIVAAFLILLWVKRMPSDIEETESDNGYKEGDDNAR